MLFYVKIKATRDMNAGRRRDISKFHQEYDVYITERQMRPNKKRVLLALQTK